MSGSATTIPFVPPASNPALRQRSENIKTAIHCIAALFGVIVFGTLEFMLVEYGWTLWKALYFTLTLRRA